MKIKKISTYRSYFIAFLDILGFKELVKTHGFKEIRDVFSHIGIDEKNISISMSRAVDDEDDFLQNYNKALKLCKIRIMSDSIVVAAPSRYAVKRRIESGGFCEFFSAISPLRPRGQVGDGMIRAVLRHIFCGFIFEEEVPLSR